MTVEYKLLKTKEAAAMLGVCNKTLNNWVKEGDIQYFVTRGGHKRFPKEELDRFLNKQIVKK